MFKNRFDPKPNRFVETFLLSNPPNCFSTRHKKEKGNQMAAFFLFI
ncbi:hypothetical protein P872_04980 [Rhodonellum psychrophilum GCM71 = DSM 17998]|uniref:Uncharacterized protein n=1 Tax=Rhodonellum psychrophilum GCM71 = DSM 17998 TaxID=1123057 RepID=U5BQW2_9BACT|nr:hypothetical protein P872_04980 [Rhodonellum psychrophilum GCM71 = DSM 17998]